MKGKFNARLVSILTVCAAAVATVLLFALFCFDYEGFFKDNAVLLTVIFSSLTIALTVLSVVYSLKDKELVFRIVFITFLFLCAAFIVLYVYSATGMRERVSSIDELRAYVSDFGGNAVLFMIILQILQVVILPIPGFVAVGATVALFGTIKGAVISLVGILLGSFIAFFVGRYLGYPAARWLVGENSLKKGLESVKGKDKAVLTFMFLFPFFPDDVLCFVAGLSSMSNSYFAVMIFLTRAVSVFTTAYSVGGKIIPYDTWWGILIWAALILSVAAISYFVYKHGEKIEKRFSKIFGKNKQKNSD